MSKAPPIPKEQRSFRGPSRTDKRDAHAEQPGSADKNLHQQGQQANTYQNLTPQRSTQDR